MYYIYVVWRSSLIMHNSSDVYTKILGNMLHNIRPVYRDDPNSNSTSSFHSMYLLWSSVSSVQSITCTTGLQFAMIPGVFWSLSVESVCRAHRDGGDSQGGTKHSLPPARRWGGFNSNDQLNSSTER